MRRKDYVDFGLIARGSLRTKVVGDGTLLFCSEGDVAHERRECRGRLAAAGFLRLDLRDSEEEGITMPAAQGTVRQA